jgi:hypothetical protein
MNSKIALILTTITLISITSGCICCSIGESVNAIKLAVTNKDAKKCEKMEDPIRTACLTSVAISTKNADTCDRIDEEDMIIGCYISVAAEKEDPNICEKIKVQEAHDSCVIQTATHMKNRKICAILTDQSKKEECVLRARQ